MLYELKRGAKAMVKLCGAARNKAAWALAATVCVGVLGAAAGAAELDLSTYGSAGSINGAYFAQDNRGPAGTGYIDPFLRIQASGEEQGYNSNYRPFQF